MYKFNDINNLFLNVEDGNSVAVSALIVNLK